MLALLLPSGPVDAQASLDGALYIGQVPVEVEPAPFDSGETDSQPTALLRALNQVLVRVTGRVGEDLVATIGTGESQALSLTLSRQFRDVEIPLVGTGTGENRTRRERQLRVEFDASAVDRLLDEAGLPRWGRERPEMLLWMAGDGQTGAEFLQPDAAMRFAMRQAEFRYGLPLTEPILDAQDRIEVTPSDIRGGFVGAAEPALQRYGADGMILLDLRQSANYWTGRWVWKLGDDEQSFSRSGATPAEVVELGLSRIAGSLAARFAVRPDALDRRQIVVSGLQRTVHYAEVQSFLAGLTGVEALRVLAANGDTVTFELVSSVDGLQQRIELSGVLRFVRHDLSTGTLYYALAL